jgi:hypothetical protein
MAWPEQMPLIAGAMARLQRAVRPVLARLR